MTDTQPKPEAKPNYKKTLNLPQTSFAMRANLVQNEPQTLRRWSAAGMYRKVREARAGAPKFIFHDGPPYANASLHLGHLMNKSLKDFVVRSQTMMGKDCPFVPGWDCHGLPIEHKVVSDLVAKGKMEKLAALAEDARRLAIRSECQRHAEKSHELQSGQMERLLTLGDYGDPYLTMQPRYEAAVLEVLAGLVEKGLVYRQLKPVHWSLENETALADAELEYQDREDISVFVDFESGEPAKVYDAFGVAEDDRGASPSFMIWTTTPWTLPANLAVAVHPEIEYALVRVDGNVTVIARQLVEKVTAQAKAESVEVLATCRGEALVGLRYRHPFRAQFPRFDASASTGGSGEVRTDTVWTVVAADYVTLEDGTGLVHTATGHGVEDYQTGLRVGLPVYCPVLASGKYDETAPDWLVGKSVWEANELVTEHLRASGHLFHDERFMHSYPHDWRSKTPVIFRATEQWFVSVTKPFDQDGGEGNLRDRSLSAVAAGESSQVKFVPEWGRNRMRGMLESRPDWCISRQRSWGLPIPAFMDSSGRVLLTAASVRAVADVVREKGSDAWFRLPPAELLAGYDVTRDPDAPAGLEIASLTKGGDILDVWFESGSSWNAVMRQRFGNDAVPVDLYLEGSDQHRGWFQLSLLPAIGVTGRPPFKTVLTHGFMVNKEGKKLSKSSGDSVEDLFQKYGADVLRWWVSSLSYENDVKVDDAFFQLAGESYRKVRNTIRFLLSNLDDFDVKAHAVADADYPPASLEAWLLHEFGSLRDACVKAYEQYQFHAAHKAIYNFCNDTLSATYLAAVKDRMYCDKADSDRRRRAQSAMWTVADGLCRLLAPVLCHTADEAYRVLHRAGDGDHGGTVHTAEFPPAPGVRTEPSVWEAVFHWREDAMRAIERAKKGASEGGLGLENPLDAGLSASDGAGVLGRLDMGDLADLCGVSRVTLDNPEGVAAFDLREEPRCERSWKRDGTVKQRSDGGMLSDRDAEALGLA
ncbi:MAG: isoleucine--tRNA ligase [Phycisphaerales bacterium]|nr:MAG: isoleucine--tRNA ligase [Phycisphaerales bacterium]